MILHDVADGADLFVERSAPPFHANRLGHGDLNVVDVFLVEQGLEDRVGKPEGEDILDGFLAEIVVDPEDLVFREDASDIPVQRLSRGEIVPEGLLDDDAGPAAGLPGLHEPGFPKFGDQGCEKIRRYGQVEQAVARQARLGLDRFEAFRKPFEAGARREFVAVVVQV